MAASRWKRFAFFDRNTLSLPKDVIEDLTSVDYSVSGRRFSVDEGDAIRMQVSTATLPMNSKPMLNGDDKKNNPSNDEETSVTAMWNALTACNPSTTSADSNTVMLSNQQQTADKSYMDGLVLVFLASQDSEKIHCVDVTVQCSAGSESEEEVSSLDGWRGYWTPFATSTTSATATGNADRIIAEHVASSSNPTTMVDLASLRLGSKLMVACTTSTNIHLYQDPHLHLSCRLSSSNPIPPSHVLPSPWNDSSQCTSVSLLAADDDSTLLVAVGTNLGGVQIYSATAAAKILKPLLTLPAPSSSCRITALAWTTFVKDSDSSQTSYALYCGFVKTSSTTARGGSAGGLCCVDLGTNPHQPQHLARHDLDARPVLSDKLASKSGNNWVVARPDGLYTYGHTQKQSVVALEGIKLALCSVDSKNSGRASSSLEQIGTSYVLVASTDAKSGRDAVDIYDATNKLVAFHVLLSPSHMALQTSSIKGTALVLTSGGALVTLTEKSTDSKVQLLVQKNLYGAAISMAYADESYPPAQIMVLYRSHAEHLYRKGDFAGAMEQYLYTIGSLEPSHVIFRFLDAPKIPLLTKYLQELRNRDLATTVHNELLRTCLLKLGNTEEAERIAASHTTAASSLAILPPKEALATVCSLDPPQAAEALVVYGPALARAMPRETAGVVVSLCLGSFPPPANAVFDSQTSEHKHPPYPVHLFSSSFLEHPKMLRLVLAHCNRHKCPLTPNLRRTLLELTLEEWKAAQRAGDTEAEKLRRKEAITSLTDAHCRDIGDYDALVLCQLAGFAEGELLLYERLQMVPMLLARYAQDGGDRARRQMLAMCRSDPQLLADVLGHFVSIASERVKDDDDSVGSEEQEILEDIREALTMARSQGVLPPVRIARILAGEGTGQFSVQSASSEQTVPLSVALDYVGEILDESRGEITRLQAEVKEYTELCDNLEQEVEVLLSGGEPGQKTDKMNIDELYARLQSALEEQGTSTTKVENKTMHSREAFWRDMNNSDDRFDTIARYFAKGLIQ